MSGNANKSGLLYFTGADPGFFLGGGAVVSCSTPTPINHIVFCVCVQNTSCIRKPQVISGGEGGAHPLHPPPRSAPASYLIHTSNFYLTSCLTSLRLGEV